MRPSTWGRAKSMLGLQAPSRLSGPQHVGTVIVPMSRLGLKAQESVGWAF